MTKLVDVAAQDPAQIPAIEQDLSMRSFSGVGTLMIGPVVLDPVGEVGEQLRAGLRLPYPLLSPWGMPDRHDRGAASLVSPRIAHRSARPLAPGAVRSGGDRSVLVACIDEWVRVETVVERARTLPVS